MEKETNIISFQCNGKRKNFKLNKCCTPTFVSTSANKGNNNLIDTTDYNIHWIQEREKEKRNIWLAIEVEDMVGL